MVNRQNSKGVIAIASLCFMPLIVLFSCIAAHGANAEEMRSPERQVSVEQWACPSQSPVQEVSGQQEDWKFTLSLGTLYKPAFLGSRDYQVMAFPDIQLEYKDRFFASLFGVGYKIVHNDVWNIGPIVKLDFGRMEDDSNPFRIAGEKSHALRGLGDVAATVELGGFVEYSMGPFTAQLELRQGVGGHKGLIAETGLNFKGFIEKPGKPIMYSFGPRATFADANYNISYFGINQRQSINSGLARYDAETGLVSYGIGGFAVVPLMDSVSLGVFGGYDRLAKVAADSPLVRKRGSEDQFMGGLRVTYEFGY